MEKKFDAHRKSDAKKARAIHVKVPCNDMMKAREMFSEVYGLNATKYPHRYLDEICTLSLADNDNANA